jgi:hypothetical protein
MCGILLVSHSNYGHILLRLEVISHQSLSDIELDLQGYSRSITATNFDSPCNYGHILLHLEVISHQGQVQQEIVKVHMCVPISVHK